MTDKELRRLSRQELLEELYDYARANGDLRLQMENREEELKVRYKKFEEELASEHHKVLVLSREVKKLKKEKQELSEKLRAAEADSREIGNIADVTVQMTGLFEEAQKTAELYVAKVKRMTEQQKKQLHAEEEKSRRDIQKLGDEATRTCMDMKQQTEKECRRLRETTEKECEEFRSRAQAEAEAYWESLSERLESFYKAHQGMRELFGTDVIRMPSYIERKSSEN